MPPQRTWDATASITTGLQQGIVVEGQDRARGSFGRLARNLSAGGVLVPPREGYSEPPWSKRNLTLCGIGPHGVRKALILGVGYQPKRNTLQWRIAFLGGHKNTPKPEP